MPNQKRKSSGSPRALSKVVPRSSARLKLSTRPAIMRKGRALLEPVEPPATTTGKTGTMHGDTPVMNPPRNAIARSSPTTEVGPLAGTPHCHCSASRRVGRCTRRSISQQAVAVRWAGAAVPGFPGRCLNARSSVCVSSAIRCSASRPPGSNPTVLRTPCSPTLRIDIRPARSVGLPSPKVSRQNCPLTSPATWALTVPTSVGRGSRSARAAPTARMAAETANARS